MRRSFFVFLSLYFVLFMSIGSIHANASSNGITSITVAKKNILIPNTESVTVSMSDSSTVRDILINYKMPGGSYTQFYLGKNSQGSFEGDIPSYYASEGAWTVTSLFIEYYNGSFSVISDYSEGGNYELDGGNFTTFTSDTAGPVFNKVSVDKTQVEVGGSVTVTVNAEDLLSDVQSISLEYILPNNNYTSFTAQSVGNNQYQFTIPSYLTSGSYGIGKFDLTSITLKDSRNNSTSIYDYSYYRTGDLSGGDFTTFKDTEGPVFNSVSVDKTRILKDGTVTITVNAQDTLSGVQSVSLDYMFPDQSYITLAAQSIGNNQYQLTFPSYFTNGSHGLGKFRLTGITLTDTKNNLTAIYDLDYYKTGDLSAGNFTVIPEGDAPIIKSSSVDKKEIYNGDPIKIVAEVEDVSGVSDVKATFLKPDGNTYTAILNHTHDNLYEAEIPDYITLNGIGTWKTYFLWVNDIYDNSMYIWSNQVFSWGEDLSNTDFYVKEKDVTPPSPPTVNSIDENSTSISGNAESGSKLTATLNGTEIGTAVADGNGYFQIPISKKAAKSEILITATDSSGNSSEVTRVIVKDVTPPQKAEVNTVYDYSHYVTGTAEPGSLINVYSDNYVFLGYARTDESGHFSAYVQEQMAGAGLFIYVYDDSWNGSGPTSVIVQDGTSPGKPEVSEVTEKSNSITGYAEVGSYVEVKKDGEAIGSGTTDQDGKFTIEIPIQKAETELVITSTDNAGNVSEATTVVVKDVTAPAKPEVNEVTDKDQSVNGQAEADSKVEVEVNGIVVGSGTAGTDGKFTIEIPAQKAGEEIVVTSTDKAGNVSETVKVEVEDVTAPAKPKVNEVTDRDNSVSGQAETGSKVEVKVNGDVIGTDIAGTDGTFTVGIPVQRAGAELVITSTDKAGNVSEAVTVEVKDVTAPMKPQVNEVTERDTSVTGQAESGSKVEVKVNGDVIGEGTAGTDSKFTIEIPVQKAGTGLAITSTDKEGNVSEATTVEVKDVIAPVKPEVKEVTDNDTAVTGHAEVGSIVEVKISGDLIATGITGTDGNFTVVIPVQKAGTELVITSTDKAANVSEATKAVVKDVTAPVKPLVNEVTDKDTSVRGQAEVGSKVEVQVNGEVIGTSTANTDGKFTVEIPLQNAGAELEVTSADNVGNVSEATKVVVKDVTAPVKPLVNEVTDKDTSVRGQAEVGSKVEVKVNGEKIGTATTGTDGKFTVDIPVQKAGTELVITATDKEGNVSEARTVVVKDTTAPAKPLVREVTDKDTTVKGQVEAESKVEVKVNEDTIGTGTTGADGEFIVDIPVQKAGTELVIRVTDNAGNVSEATTVVVKDVTAPDKPQVNEVTDKDTTVSGQAEADSKVKVKVNGEEIGTGAAGTDGNFAIDIPVQKAGTELVIIATDKAGNVSEATTVVVKDITIPDKPQVNEVTDKDTTVSGQAEADSKVKVKVKGEEIGTGAARTDGNFAIDIPVQKAGTELVITATDKAGNVSEATTVVVKDVTTPDKPQVNEITDKGTTVSGQAEADSKVNVKVNGEEIGTGTAGTDGNFAIDIPVQKAGTELLIIATDKAGNVSEATTVVVKDVTTPDKPQVNEVTDKDTTVSGQAEADSKVKVKVNGEEIGTGTAGTDGKFTIEIPVQKAGTKIIITTADKAGNVSEEIILVVKDITAPILSKVNAVTDQSKEVTGLTEPGVNIIVAIGSNQYKAIADARGNFKVAIPRQKAGVKISVTANDGKNISQEKIVTVLDKTGPTLLTVSEVSNKSTQVTGITEALASVTVTIGTKKYSGKADGKGYFKVIIPTQKAGTMIQVVSYDAVGNLGTTKSITILDRIKPNMPTVNTVSNLTKVLIGKAEAGATVTVTIGTKKYFVKVDNNGNYKVTIPVQKSGSKLTVAVKDTAGNVSTAKSVIVIDKIAPKAPKINTVVKSKTKEISGTAEAYSIITIKAGNKVIGTAKADLKGKFRVKIKSQKKNTTLYVTAKDQAKNVSRVTKVKVR